MMPNIMLTYRCNLHCPYCFANEFVNKEKTDITIRNFLKAVSFITRTESYIGIIGGEPTVHPGFQTIMELLIADPKVKGVRLFTNGILLDRYYPQVVHPKVEICVNVNSPEAIGEKTYAGIVRNLDALVLESNKRDQVLLGFNLYSDDMDYSYMMELLQRYDMHSVRTSVTVPDFSKGGETDAMAYFRQRKAFLLEFYRKMDSIQVLPFSDCNHPPFCIWNEEEKQWLESYVRKYATVNFKLIEPWSRCTPVIDILPTLQAVRCFGMSDFMKVPISDFRDVPDLYNFFLNEIDAVAYKLPACGDCRDCHEWKTLHCFAGCIGYKADRIRACNEAMERG